MPLAHNLDELIHRYGGAIAAGAESVLVPRHRPGNPLPDLSSIEQCRSAATGTPFKFYPSQKEKVARVIAGLKAKGRVWMVCDCGTDVDLHRKANGFKIVAHLAEQIDIARGPVDRHPQLSTISQDCDRRCCG